MSTWKERFEDILDDIQNRFRNPIILSFILVWLYFHWSILYKVLTMDNSMNVDERTYKIQHYVSENGWVGMIGLPLLVAFSSLIAFYLIGIAAQFIKVMAGKRLNAALLAKIDTGNYALKEEVDRYKKDNTRKQERIERLVDSKGTLESKLEVTEGELTKKSNNHNALLNTIEDLRADSQRQTEAYAKQDNDAKNEIAELTKSYRMLKVEKEDLDIEINKKSELITSLNENVQKLSTLLEYSDNPKTLEDVFGKSTWVFTSYSHKESLQQTFTVMGNTFVMDNGITFLITDFSFNRVEKTLYFNKANIKGEYHLIPTRLKIEDSDLLIGIEDIDTHVEYQRGS